MHVAISERSSVKVKGKMKINGLNALKESRSCLRFASSSIREFGTVTHFVYFSVLNQLMNEHYII